MPQGSDASWYPVMSKTLDRSLFDTLLVIYCKVEMFSWRHWEQGVHYCTDSLWMLLWGVVTVIVTLYDIF